MVETLKLDLVLEPFLELGATEDVLDLAQLAVLALDGPVHHLLVLVGQHPRGLFQHLAIVAVLVSPLTGRGVSQTQRRQRDRLHVLHRSLVQVQVDVVERVLGDVTHTECRVLVHGALLRNRLARQELD